MKEYKKIDLIKYLNENSELEIDEMGLHSKHDDYKTNDARGNFWGKNSEIRRGDEESIDKKGKTQKGRPVARLWKLEKSEHPEQDPRRLIGYIYVVEGDNIEQVLNRYPDLLDEIKSYGIPEENIGWTSLNKIPENPIRRANFKMTNLGGEDKTFDTTVSVKQAAPPYKINNEIFYKILREELINPEFNAQLAVRSIPMLSLKIDEPSVDRKEKEAMKKNAHYVALGLHKQDLYPSVISFFDAVTKRIDSYADAIENQDVDSPEQLNIDVPNIDGLRNIHARYHFKNNRASWEQDRANKKEYYGKTDIYNLDKKDYREENYDINVGVDFYVVGQSTNMDSFTWVLTFKTNIGSKLASESRISKGFLNDKEIIEREVVRINRAEYTPIMELEEVQNSLRRLLRNFKNKILDILPEDAIEIANVRQYDIGNDMNETFINKIINKLKEE